MTPRWNAPRWPSTILTTSTSCFTPTVIASDTHPATLPTTRSRRSLLRSRPSRSRLSPWTAWQMATSRQLTVARLHVTSPGPACTTRCPTRVTTFPRSLQTPSPARSWKWHIFDHTLAECDAPDFFGSNGLRAIAHDRRGRRRYETPSSSAWNSSLLSRISAAAHRLRFQLATHDQVAEKLQVAHDRSAITSPTLIVLPQPQQRDDLIDRKSTRLNSSHLVISYAVFCLKKKKKK